MPGPRIDYWRIEKEIAEVLRAGLDPGITVTIEQEMMFSPEQTPWVGVYLDRRDADQRQSLALGTRMRYQIKFTVWAWCYSLEREASFIARNAVIGDIELVLMANRTLNDLVETSWITGGAMPSAKVDSTRLVSQSANFLSGGEINLVIVASAIST